MDFKSKVIYLLGLKIPVEDIAQLLDKTLEEMDIYILNYGLYPGVKIRTIPTPRIVNWLKSGMTIEDIAKVTGCSTKAVGKTIKARNLDPKLLAPNPNSTPHSG